MVELPHKVWNGINDFLLSLGSHVTVRELYAAMINGIQELIPFDNSGVLIEFRHNASPAIINAVGIEEKWRHVFNDSIIEISCPENDKFRSSAPGTDPDATYSANYRELMKHGFRKDTYLNEFIAPQGIRFSAGLVITDHENRPVSTLVINRSGSGRMFSGAELDVMRIIQPHIANYYATASILEQFRRLPVLLSETEAHSRVLSKRESEIVYLLARRHRPAEIAAEMNISILTVRKHIRHIYEKLEVTDRHQLFQKVNRSFTMNK